MKKIFEKYGFIIFLVVVALAVVGLVLYIKRKRPFYDNFFDKGSLGFVTKQPHGLKELDIIDVKQDAGAMHSEYDGIADVVKVIDNYKFVVNKGFLESSPVNGGYFVKQNLF